MSEGVVNKQELRKILANKRDLIENRAEKSKIIQNILCKLDFYENSKNVMVYSSIKSEVSTDLLIDRLFLENKRVIFPKCAENFELLPVEAASRAELSKKSYGILEPKASVSFPKEKIDIVIIPAIAYDTKKNRLGYGAGYYDRFLADFKGVKVGFCFKEMLTSEKIPVNKFDIKVDIIITDYGIY